MSKCRRLPRKQSRAELHARVRAALATVSFLFMALPTRVDFLMAARVRRRGPRLRVTINTLDRDTGDPIQLGMYWSIPPSLPTNEHAIDWIYACVRETWVHELNEAFHMNEGRRRDLHFDNGSSRPPPPDLVDPWFDVRELA